MTYLELTIDGLVYIINIDAYMYFSISTLCCKHINLKSLLENILQIYIVMILVWYFNVFVNILRFLISPLVAHRFCNSLRACLKCRRMWVRVQIASNQRL